MGVMENGSCLVTLHRRQTTQGMCVGGMENVFHSHIFVFIADLSYFRYFMIKCIIK